MACGFDSAETEAMTQIAESDRGRPSRSSSGLKFLYTALIERRTECALNTLVTIWGSSAKGRTTRDPWTFLTT
jgi:hypothetical protein